MSDAENWPPQASAVGLPEGLRRNGSTGQLFEVIGGQWVWIRPEQLAAPIAAEVGGLVIAERLDVDMTIIAGAFARALQVGAPDLSEHRRRAIINSALIRLRHTLKPAGPR